MQRDEFLNQSRPFGWKLAFKQRAIRNMSYPFAARILWDISLICSK